MVERLFPPPGRRFAYAADQLPRLTSTLTYKKNKAASVTVVTKPRSIAGLGEAELSAAWCFPSGNVANKNEHASSAPHPAAAKRNAERSPCFSASKTSGEQETAPAPH